tara:strand:- start:54 stop:383 length:330 start_codon:yes stop_codon:yes gene_type:complete
MSEELATEKQLKFMGSLGIDAIPGMTKQQARLAIEGKVGKSDKPAWQKPRETEIIPPTSVMYKDRLIVRQSSLKAAVETFMTISSTTDVSQNSDGIKDLAEQFEEWVFR